MAKKYEGSKADIAEDKRGARKLGVGLRKYERTSRDRAEDKRGQARMMLKKKGG